MTSLALKIFFYRYVFYCNRHLGHLKKFVSLRNRKILLLLPTFKFLAKFELYPVSSCAKNAVALKVN